METMYDSDVSNDTRELIARGLATDIRRYSSRVELKTSEQGLAPNRNMSTSHVRLPHAPVVLAEEPSTRGLNLTCMENFRGQNHNRIISSNNCAKQIDSCAYRPQ